MGEAARWSQPEREERRSTRHSLHTRGWVELVDTLVSETSARKGVRVRVPPCVRWWRLTRLNEGNQVALPAIAPLAQPGQSGCLTNSGSYVQIVRGARGCCERASFTKPDRERAAHVRRCMHQVRQAACQAVEAGSSPVICASTNELLTCAFLAQRTEHLATDQGCRGFDSLRGLGAVAEGLGGRLQSDSTPVRFRSASRSTGEERDTPSRREPMFGSVEDFRVCTPNLENVSFSHRVYNVRAASSAAEHPVFTRGVEGSNPSQRTR